MRLNPCRILQAFEDPKVLQWSFCCARNERAADIDARLRAVQDLNPELRQGLLGMPSTSIVGLAHNSLPQLDGWISRRINHDLWFNWYSMLIQFPQAEHSESWSGCGALSQKPSQTIDQFRSSSASVGLRFARNEPVRNPHIVKAEFGA